MKATVVHDDRGDIVAIAKIRERAGSKFTRAGLLPTDGQRIVEIELSEEQAARPAREIHASYRVDPATSRLVQKDA
jgi:hypothetical protein